MAVLISGTLLYGPLKVLRQFQVHPCRHSSLKPATACIRSVIKKNKRTFFVATQVSDKGVELLGLQKEQHLLRTKILFGLKNIIKLLTY